MTTRAEEEQERLDKIQRIVSTHRGNHYIERGESGGFFKIIQVTGVTDYADVVFCEYMLGFRGKAPYMARVNTHRVLPYTASLFSSHEKIDQREFERKRQEVVDYISRGNEWLPSQKTVYKVIEL